MMVLFPVVRWDDSRGRESQRWKATVLLGVAGAVMPPQAMAQPVWTVSAKPEFSVGDRLGEGPELYQVQDATLLADGRLVLLNGGTKEPFVYEKPGVLVRTVGRDGDGPGEYRELVKMRRDGKGGLWIYDRTIARSTHLGMDFEVVEVKGVGYDLGAGWPTSASLRPFMDGSLPLVQGTVPILEDLLRGGGLRQRDLRVLVIDGRDRTEIAQVSGGKSRR